MSLLDSTPSFRPQETIEFARDVYGLEVQETKRLDSERDQNIRLDDANGDRYVLKISSARDSRPFLQAQNELIQRVSGAVAGCPSIRAAQNGELISEIRDENGVTFLTRLVTFVPGQVLAELPFRSPSLLRDIGQFMGQVSLALEGYQHPALEREFPWDLAQAAEVVENGADHLNGKQRTCVERVAETFKLEVGPLLQQLPRSVVHNDANDANVIIGLPANGDLRKARVTGLIDFGDAVYTWTISELAIAVAYAILDSPDPLMDAREVVKGYHGRRPISEAEIESLFGLICMRLCVSAVMAAKQQRERPDDPYLSVSQAPLWRTLPRLQAIPYRFARAVFRDAIDLCPQPASERVQSFLNAQPIPSGFPLSTSADERLGELDLSVESEFLSGCGEVDERRVRRAVEMQLEEQEASIGVGRYNEPRLVYNTDQFSTDGGWIDEPRTIHLGVDLFAEAGREVLAPFPGVVQRVCSINKALDYGPLVILRHATTDGETFYTLFGHLSSATLSHVKKGQDVCQGQSIGWLGEPTENGGWTPHLHFQLITDLLDLEEEFPGVGHASLRRVWSALSPNPNLMLRIAEPLTTSQSTGTQDTLELRKRKLGGSLSVGYDKPLKLVRGWMQHLWDDSGRRYLDAYNNVPHLGHCHPQVVEAADRQMRLLNTNTRYLHDLRIEFAERLSATLPAPLDVCFFLNSASEANELALRLARCYTGRKSVVVLEAAYHGNTNSLIDISPYKHDGPGGGGPPTWVRTAPIPDCYRGAFRDTQTAGKLYAQQLAPILADLHKNGEGLSAFIAETCPSVGGQIIPPAGYLANVYRQVREAGGLCIADEVQTGYGRLGEAFYGFQLQDVVPDIVVLGKPIGNGHPLAAVVTTVEIADRFDNGMEFFSTFGGNTVSCAIGLAVLDVLESEDLPANAQFVGKRLLNGLSLLQQEFPIIGDVRGAGFFLGAELVQDPNTLVPAAWEASFVSNRMRERGVLIGTDGPLHNVLKIRPPMPFSQENADQLLAALRESLAELP